MNNDIKTGKDSIGNLYTRDGYAINFSEGGYPYIVLNADYDDSDDSCLLECRIIKQLNDNAIKVVKMLNSEVWKVIKIKDNDYDRAVEYMHNFCGN